MPALAVHLLAIVSLSLAIVNLFPFLPLDGGHIFWAVVELFRRQARALQRDGARGGRRLHARDRPVRDRPHRTTSGGINGGGF